MAAKKVKPATDSIIGRRVRINDDATYPNGNRHAWAGFTGTVRVHNGRSVYQVEMDDAEAIEVFPLDSFTLLVDAYLADAAAVDTSAPATPGTPEPTAPDHGELAMLDIAHIVRSKTNPRKHFDADALAELAASIKLQGVAQPILVRPLPASRVQETAENRLPGAPLPTHELVAGERRYRACKQAGVKAVPALIRHLTDTQVLELQLVENLKRSDLHPMEEAEGYEALMQQAGMTADQIADRIGKSKSYVYKSLKLLDLSPNSRTAFYDGKISASVALLVARHIELHQAEIIKEVAKPDYRDEVMSFRQAQEWIHNHYMLKLGEAPFKIADATLVPSAGSCKDCPKRTGANPDLFTDVKVADTCTDKTCFTLKRDAHTERLKAEVQARGQTLITGKEAKEIIPHQHLEPKGYKVVDTAQFEGKSLRKLLGKDMPTPVMVENPHTHELVAMLPNATVNKLLKDRGLVKPSAAAQKLDSPEAKKAQAEELYHVTWRKRAVTAVYAEALKPTGHQSGEVHPAIVTALRLNALDLIEYVVDGVEEFASLIGIDSKIATADELKDIAKTADLAQLQALTFAAYCHGDVSWGNFNKDKLATPNIDQFAADLHIDLDAIKKAVQADMREAEAAKAKPAAKPTDKAAPQADNAKPKRKAKTTPEEAQAAIAQAMQAADANTTGAEA